MKEIEKRILNEIQKGIPIEKRPFLTIAKRLNLEEEQIIECIKGLKQNKCIRRIGAVVDVNKIGAISTLVAIKVKKEDIEKVISIINEYNSVTHNYEREDEYNIWFTLMAATKKELDNLLKEIVGKISIYIDEFLNLPSAEKYKTYVYFNL
ncbi:Lrp/AsnC family transcriptional regulator [Clostridium bovifaecis]|uniref:siroheme decarboxylase n=1 Tax=Clostridium bovifaecis TaxID=2184719 RepID=A0A6I6F1J8_9CLOT|nr:Lrp/AsnC family transcriptional regulator [Clostridium bovifaecis]